MDLPFLFVLQVPHRVPSQYPRVYVDQIGLLSCVAQFLSLQECLPIQSFRSDPYGS